MRLSRTRSCTAAVVVGATLLSGAVGVAAQRKPTVDDLLAAAARYLTEYEREVTAVVAEESYLQEVPFEDRSRHLRSDLLVLQDAATGWIGFRDVFEVDARPVRDRDQRLVKLFLQPRRDAADQARRIVGEGTRYNLSPRRVQLRRTINMPLTPLYFLRGQNQRRSTFHIDPSADPDEHGAIAVAFTEHALPRVVATPDHAPARGAFWIEPDSGRVSAAVLIIKSRDTLATIHIAFAEQAAFDMWLPVTMNEEYAIGTHGTVVGRAEYSNFRRFRVDTTTEIQP